MTAYNSKTIATFIDNLSFGTSRWLGLLSALLLSGCGGDPDVDWELDNEIAGLESVDETIRENSLLHIRDFPGGAKGAPMAVELLGDTSEKVRSAAIQLLVKFEHNTPEAVAALTGMASNDSNEKVRSEAFMSLNTLATDKFIELCITYLKGNDEGKQEIGANGLQRVEVGAAEAAQTALVARLKSGSSAGVRSQCAGALAMLGAKATAETIAALEAAASDPDKTVADGAKDALDTLK